MKLFPIRLMAGKGDERRGLNIRSLSLYEKLMLILFMGYRIQNLYKKTID